MMAVAIIIRNLFRFSCSTHLAGSSALRSIGQSTGHLLVKLFSCFNTNCSFPVKKFLLKFPLRRIPASGG